jgi:hypothetical protein
MPGDDQPDDSSSLWFASYISNDSGFDPNLYAVVFRATEKNWVTQLQNAIYQQGRGRYFNVASVQPWSCGGVFSGGVSYVTEACVVYARPLSATSPVGIAIPYSSELYSLFNVGTGTYVGTAFRAVVVPSGLYALSRVTLPREIDQFQWRYSIPPGFAWILAGEFPQVGATGTSNDCTNLPIIYDNVCYQTGITPY